MLTHPFVIGEIALGHLKRLAEVLGALDALPKAVVASDAEVLILIARERLPGRGIGYVDAHILAAVRLTQGASLWTRNLRLRVVADALGNSTPV